MKETLLGASLPADLTQESHTTFFEHSRQDGNGDYYMEEEDYINAAAPPDENDDCYMVEEDYINAIALPDENYVSSSPLQLQLAGSR
jgi:hypothetical protein